MSEVDVRWVHPLKKYKWIPSQNLKRTKHKEHISLSLTSHWPPLDSAALTALASLVAGCTGSTLTVCCVDVNAKTKCIYQLWCSLRMWHLSCVCSHFLWNDLFDVELFSKDLHVVSSHQVRPTATKYTAKYKPDVKLGNKWHCAVLLLCVAAWASQTPDASLFFTHSNCCNYFRWCWPEELFA